MNQRFIDYLNSQKLDFKVVEFDSSTRTSQEAADSIGCSVSQIAKSLIFKTEDTNKPVLVIASGSNKVDTNKVGKLMNAKIVKPDAEYVLETVGYSIGGVPPAGHVNKVDTYIDSDLMGFLEIWAAAGTPNSVFKLTPNQLKEMTKGIVSDIKLIS